MTLPDSPDGIPFTPAPCAGARHDGWTPDRQRLFIAGLLALGGVAAAARAAGKSTQSVYLLRRRAGAESFAVAWDAALAMGRDRAFERAVDRGLYGYTRPVHRDGRVVGQRHAVDNRLLYAACYAQPMPRIRNG